MEQASDIEAAENNAAAQTALAEAAERAISVPAEAGKETGEGGEENIAIDNALTAGERATVIDYAVGDEEVRRIIIADYLSSLKARGSAPPVLQGGAGTSPAPPPKSPRDMREAAILAEAVMRRK